jgi:hypothetical protein
MVDEDGGIARFFYHTLSLGPMPEEEAMDLLTSKFGQVEAGAEKLGVHVAVGDKVVERVVALSGGHPHILQLLGSHLVEHENADPDGVVDSSDLFDALHQICYEDRASVYESTVHHLEVNNALYTLRLLLGMEATSPRGIVSSGFPTFIDRALAAKVASPESIQWLVEHNIIAAGDPEVYSLLDEFLRIRLLFDSFTPEEEIEVERELIETGELEDSKYFPPYDDSDDL